MMQATGRIGFEILGEETYIPLVLKGADHSNNQQGPPAAGETSDESSTDLSASESSCIEVSRSAESHTTTATTMRRHSEDSDTIFNTTNGSGGYLRERTNSSGTSNAGYQHHHLHHASGGLRERTTSQTDRDIEMQTLVATATNSVTTTSSSPTATSRLRRNVASSINSGNLVHNKQYGSSSISLRWTRRWVDWVQSIRIREDVPLLTGLDRVLLPSPTGARPTAACAEAVLIAGARPPRYLWYMLSGSGCDVLQFATLYALKSLVHLKDASVIWCAGFLLNIPCRHTSHRYLVFGDYVGGYWRSLARMYAGYSIIIFLSTLFNMVMSRIFEGVDMPLLWLTTMLWTGVVNYFILKRFWSFGGSSERDQQVQQQ